MRYLVKEELFRLTEGAFLATQDKDDSHYRYPLSCDNPKTNEERWQYYKGLIDAIQIMGLEQEYINWRIERNAYEKKDT